MTAARSDHELFDDLLAASPSPWSLAKRQAFARLCEAFPDPGGPSVDGLRQLRRGAFDARIPAEWAPVFEEVYLQWLGFAADQEELRPAPLLSPSWWFEAPRALRALPRSAWPLLSPGALLLLALALCARLAWSDLAGCGRAERALSALSAATRTTDEDLAAAERLALTSLAVMSDGTLESYLATEASLRSRYDAATQQHARLIAAIESAAARTQR